MHAEWIVYEFEMRKVLQPFTDTMEVTYIYVCKVLHNPIHIPQNVG